MLNIATLRPLLLASILANLAARGDAQQLAQPAPAPVLPPPTPTRAQENVVRQAEDGFGATIGRESIGIYTAGNVRGFSALAAGNARINGLYFDQVAAPSLRIRRSTAIRVGLSAITFPFPAPTGVVDYSLIRPGSASLSGTISGDSYENASLEIDFVLPLAGDRLSIGGGAGLFHNEFANGATSTQTMVGLSALFRPTADIEVQPFWTRTDTYSNTIGPAYAPAGGGLPSGIPQRSFLGQDWARFDGASLLYGVVGQARPADGWTIDLGLFRSVFLTDRDTFVLLDDIQPDGRGRYLVFTDPPGTTASTSGELRVTRVFSEGPRTHRIIASLRGRERHQLFGGSDERDFGAVSVGERRRFAEPAFAFSEQSRDRVRQVSGGVAYALRWTGLGEVSLGLSATDYSKRVRRPQTAEAETSSSPLLFYGSVAAHLTNRLALYGGYTRGLEESGVAPQNAINRNEALPAIQTRQLDAGFRWSITDRFRFVAGLFDVRKPYFSRDAGGLFTQLGDIRSRGLEGSLSGQVTSRLRLVVGAVLSKPEVTGEGVRLGRVGVRPVGFPTRKIDFNLDWQSPISGVSLDLRVAHQSRRPATTLNTAFLPERTVIDLGARYRFHLAGNEATLRASVSNVLNQRGFDLFGSGTYDIIEGRVFSAYLTVDF